MSRREAFIDYSFGETRAVVTLDGQPERLIIRRDGDEARTQLGAVVAARVETVEAAFSSVFLDLGQGAEAMAPFRNDERPVRGAMVRVEIRAEPRRGKVAVARLLGEADGQPRILQRAPELTDVLKQAARGAEIVEGDDAEAAADDAQSQVLAVIHSLPGGGTIAVEPTRALTAIDVDLGDRKGADSKRAARAANLAAIAQAARLLRLKGLGGLVVLDLVGRGHDGPAMLTAARNAFALDNPGVAIGPISRFGTMELSLPWRIRPLAEVLRREDGALDDRTLAQQLVRRLAREGRARGGARFEATCAPEVAAAAKPLVDQMSARFGARFALKAVEGPRERLGISSL